MKSLAGLPGLTVTPSVMLRSVIFASLILASSRVSGFLLAAVDQNYQMRFGGGNAGQGKDSTPPTGVRKSLSHSLRRRLLGPKEPLTPPPGTGIRKDASNNVWAGDYLLLDGMDKNLGLDVGDKRGVFVRTYTRSSMSRRQVSLGRMVCDRWMAASRQKLWWMVPSWGSTVQELPPESQFLLLRMSPPLADAAAQGGPENETFVCVIPMVSGAYRSSLHNGGLDRDNLVVTIESGDNDTPVDQAADLCYVSTGSNPYALLADAFAAIADRTQSFNVRAKKTMPPTLDCFGWGTWDAFYTDVTGTGIAGGLDTLSAGGTPAKALIIDDGWQDVRNDDSIWLPVRKPRTVSRSGEAMVVKALEGIQGPFSIVGSKISAALEW